MYRSQATCALLLFFITLPLHGQAKLDIIGGNRFEFGDVYAGLIAKHTVQLHNAGTDTLILSDISSTCGCTGMLISSDRIAPGDTGLLEITFDSKRFSGIVERAVTMNTNDPAVRRARITFKANVIKGLEVDPEYLFFRVVADSTASQILTIKNAGATGVSIVGTTTDIEGATLTLSGSDLEPASEAALTVSITPKKAGTIKGYVRIRTTHPKMDLLNIRVMGIVSSAVPPTGSQGH